MEGLFVRASDKIFRAYVVILLVVACTTAAPVITSQATQNGPDTTAISAFAKELSADNYRGRGPWTRDNERAARRLAEELQRLGAKPVFGSALLVPFTTEPRPRDTAFNVIGVIPSKTGAITGELVGLTAHLDHLGVDQPDARGDSIYNGFLDDALGMAMVLDVAKRYARTPGDRPLLVMFFNLEEQGLLGAKALLARADVAPLVSRLELLVGVDAGAPAGEALEWQLMGASPMHAGGRLADSLARARGWTTTQTPPRAINDVFPFAQRGVPIVFPIPGRMWKNFTDAQRTAAMQRFDHYHQPSDEWNADFPLVGVATFADWLWSIVREATDARRPL
jgi:Zn-dependent M28 family amino/carboxypeptidase